MSARISCLTLAVCTLGLGACSSVGHLPPDQMVRQSLQSSMARDSQYQFEGRVYFEPSPTDASAPQNAAPEKPSPAAAAEDHGHEHEAGHDHQAKNDPERGVGPWLNHWVGHSSLNYQGAVDVPAGKMEIVPELRYQTRASVMAMSLPMQLDVKQGMLIADTAGVSPWVNLWGSAVADSNKTLIPEDKLLVVRWGEQTPRQKLVQELLTDVPAVLDHAYAQLDKNLFQTLAMDETGRQLGARHRVSMKLNYAQNEALAKAMLEHWRQRLTSRKAQQPELAEDYDLVLGGMQLMATLYGMGPYLTDTDAAESEAVAAAAAADAAAESAADAAEAAQAVLEHSDTTAADAASGPAASEAHEAGAMGSATNSWMQDWYYTTEFYLDRRGRLLGIRQQAELPAIFAALMGSSPSRQLPNMVSWLRLHHTPNPKFTLQATPANSVDISQRMFELLQGNGQAASSGTVQGLKDLAAEHDNVTVEVR